MATVSMSRGRYNFIYYNFLNGLNFKILFFLFKFMFKDELKQVQDVKMVAVSM